MDLLVHMKSIKASNARCVGESLRKLSNNEQQLKFQFILINYNKVQP